MIDAGKPKVALDVAEHPVPSVDCDHAESRIDPLSGNATIFAPHRGKRPEEFVDHRDTVHRKVQCPFCPGNEKITPPPVWVGRLREDSSHVTTESPQPQEVGREDWNVRVVPNKFPAVRTMNHRTSRLKDTDRSTSLFQSSPIVGAHEVIIESRQHVQSISELDLSELMLAFRAYRDRLRHWRSVEGIKYISLFKNVGLRAGASLRHSHSQLIATDAIPPAVKVMLDRMSRHQAKTGCCLKCDLIRAELKEQHRVVWNDGTLMAYCPFASELPMLVRITTLQHQACFEDLDTSTIKSISRIANRVVRWIEMIRPGASYNFCLRTCPPGADSLKEAFHWAIDIFPRMTHVAGFEWSSRCMINPVLPEIAAHRYRACVAAEDPRLL